MASPAQPSTPVAQKASSIPPSGTWKHPRIDEIVRRQNASIFSSDNMRRILYNAGGIISTLVIGRALSQGFPGLFQRGRPFHQYADYGFWILQTLFMFNIIVACLPLFRQKDDLSDIPLTPAQRKLLGLPPSSAPPTPGSQYSTPPRYARSSTPMSASSASKGVNTSSPLSGKGSPASGSISQPLFSPGSRIGGLDGSRRHSSFGSPSPLGPGGTRSTMEAPDTPSPTAVKGANIGLNSKWLYDKGRRNSGNVRLYS